MKDKQALTESSPSVSVSPAHAAPGVVVIGRTQCASRARPLPFPSSRFLSVSARLSVALCDRNTRPSSVSAPDSSSSSDVGRTRVYSENAWRECECECDASEELPGTRRWGDDTARGGGAEVMLGGMSGGVSEYGGGLLLGALIVLAEARRSRARACPQRCATGVGVRDSFEAGMTAKNKLKLMLVLRSFLREVDQGVGWRPQAPGAAQQGARRST